MSDALTRWQAQYVPSGAQKPAGTTQPAPGSAIRETVASGSNLDELLAKRTHVQNEKESWRNKANWLVSGGASKEVALVSQGAIDEAWERYNMYDQWEKELDEQIAQAQAANGGVKKAVAQGAALLDAGAREEKKSAVRAKAQADAEALAGYTSAAPGSDLQNMALLLAGAKGKETAERRAEELDFVGERVQDTYKDSWTGQFEANADLGRINQESNKAWNDYLSDPTEENRERAFMYAALAEKVAGNARGALEYDSKAKWLTQSVAGYLPQWWDQTKAQVKGAVVGGLSGASAGAAGILTGARLGATAASSQESYNNMRGQAFRDLVMMGVDEATAREAANDEAFLSALIEGAETYISFGVLGFDELANMFAGAAKKAGRKGLTAKLMAKLPTKWQPAAKVGMGAVKNAATEYTEEFAQQGVSIANQRRMESGGETGKLDLAGETAKVFGGAVTGQDAEALKQMHEAGKQGAILGAFGAGTSQVVNQSVAAVAPYVRVKEDPLAQAMFGQNRQNDPPADTGTPYDQAVSPQDGAGTRMDDEMGADTAAEQNSAQGAQEASADDTRELAHARFGDEDEAAGQERDDLMRAMFGEETKNAGSGMETTAVDTNPATHTPEENRTIEAFRDAVDENILSFYQAAVRGENPKSFALKPVSNRAAEDIKRLVGRDVSGFGTQFDARQAEHIYDDHGENGKSDHSMADPNDVARIQYVLDNYDVATDGGQTDAYWEPKENGRNRQAKTVVFAKKVNGTYYVVEAVPVTKARKVNIVSAYMLESGKTPPGRGKKIEGNSQLPDASAPWFTAETDSATNPSITDTTIPQPANSVNSTPEATGNLPQGIGAAEADFLTPDSHSTERTSNLATGAAQFTGREGEATGLERADYDKLFRYQTETEAQRRQQATNMLYFNKDGQRVFLGDIDREGYQELVDYLANAPAWNGVMTETAMLIKNEMQGRALFDPMFPVPENGFGVTQEDYAGWLQVMREHATETGRGTQAWAAWTRRDNESGQATELEAWENLQESRLSEEERREVFAQVVQYDQAIEQAQTPEALSDIIMEIADQRGTTHGLTGKQSNRLVNRVRKALGSLSMEELRQLAYSSSSALTTDRTPADAGRKIKAIQVLNMLSSPKTPTTNLTGNTSFYGIDAMAMQGAAVLDMALAQVTGTRSVAMEGFVGSKQSRASIAKAIQRSLAEITLDVDMGGQSRYGDSRRTFKADGAGVFGTGKGVDKFAERILSVLERNMGYALTTTDEAYKGAARATAAGTQKLIDEGKIKTEDPNYAKDRADELAKYRTFQKDGYIANALQVLHDWINAIPFLGIGDSGKRVGSDGQLKVHAFGAGDLVAPFTRVAGNLVSTAVDYNPAKAIQGTVEIVDAIRKAKQGDADPARQAKAVSDTARGLTGTAISLAVRGLVKAGVVKRAEDEDDEDVAALNQSEGMTGTQINIDAALRWVSGKGAEWQAGDTLVDVSRLEPLNFLFSFGAELADDENDGFLSTVGEVAGDAGSAFVSAAGDLPVMGTVAGVAKDTLVYGDDLGTALTENLGKTAISSATPNWLAALAKGVDDKQRSTYSGDGVGDVLLDTLFSRIPGLRESLPTSVNTLGEEKDNPGNLVQRLVNAMINPVGVNEYSQSEVSKEMERVREQTSETGFYPTKSIPSKLSYTKDGVKHETELTYEQRQAYQTARSGAQMSVSAALIGSDGYRSADAKTQAALLDRAYDYANQFARGQVLGEDSMEGWARNSRTAQTDLGVSQAEFFCLYEKYGSSVMGGTGYEKTKRMVKAGLTVDQWATMRDKVDADDNGNVKKAELEAYIEGNFPRNQWSKLFEAYKGGNNWKNPY